MSILSSIQPGSDSIETNTMLDKFLRATKFKSIPVLFLKACRKAGFHLSPSHNLISPWLVSSSA